MSFLAPAFLLGALAVALPVLLHLLRRDIAPEVPFTAVRLLRRSPVERSRRRRLRDLILLAARVAAILLLAGAFARPYLQAGEGGGLLVVAVDRSYSMSAPGRYERAQELARASIREAGLGTRVALIAFDDRAEILADPGSASDAASALAMVNPGSGATRYAALLQKVAELADGSPGRLVIVTDLQRSGWNDGRLARLPADWQLDLRDPGGASGNLSLSALRIEPDRLVATIGSTWSTTKTGRLRIISGRRELAGAPFTVGAGDLTHVPVPVRATAGGLEARIDDPGGLPADDVRYEAIGGAQSNVLIVGAGAARQSGFYLARALETSSEEPEGFVAEISTGQALTSVGPDTLRKYSAVLLLSTRGLSRQARESLRVFTREGGGLVLAAAPDLEPSVVSSIFDWSPALHAEESGETLSFTATDVRHPILRPFGALSANLGRVRFARTWRIRPDGWDVVARFSDGTPALLERTEGRGRVALFASDVDRRWNDFPLHPSFVPFAIESVRHAGSSRQDQRSFTVANAPAGIPQRPGLYERASADRSAGAVRAGLGLVAVNADPRESVLDRLTEDEFRAQVRIEGAPAPTASALQARQREAAQGLWQYGLILMLAALVAESAAGRVR